MMMSYYILAVCVVSLFVKESVAQAQTDLINTLKAAESLAGAFEQGDFETVVKDVVQIASTFLKYYPSVVNLTLGLAPTQSPSTQSAELEYLRKLSVNINEKFEQVNSQFNDVKRLIQWTAVQATYATLEHNIVVVSDHFSLMFTGMNHQKNIFISSYQSTYSESGSKLYNGFMHDNGVISQGILQSAMNFTDNSRIQMRTLMLGILKLLFMAAKVELGYQTIQGFTSTIPFYSQQWQDKIERVKQKMKTIDLELKEKYKDQYKKDVNTFSKNNFGLSNNIFSRFLYRELSTKYFWRDWLVVVSSHTDGQNDAHSNVCSGYIISENGKDIVIDSVEKNTTSFDFHHVQGTCASLQQTCQNTLRYNPCDDDPTRSHPRYRRCGEYTTENADPFFNRITDYKTLCSPYSSIGIINTFKRPVYYAGPTDLSSDRLFVCDLNACNYCVHFFG